MNRALSAAIGAWVGGEGWRIFGFVGLTFYYKRKAMRLTLFLPFFRKSFVLINK